MTSELPPDPNKPRQPPRVLVLGATGMLGHKLIQRLAARGLPVFRTMRSSSMPDTSAARLALGAAQKILPDVDVLQDGVLQTSIDAGNPDVGINAVGVVKHVDLAKA